MAASLLEGMARNHGLCPAQRLIVLGDGFTKLWRDDKQPRRSQLGTASGYLARVYPTAAERLMTMPIREVESFFESLHFFYDHGCDQLERCGEPG
eukprot:83760-Prymnesium_polylepis.1